MRVNPSNGLKMNLIFLNPHKKSVVITNSNSFSPIKKLYPKRNNAAMLLFEFKQKNFCSCVWHGRLHVLWKNYSFFGNSVVNKRPKRGGLSKATQNILRLVPWPKKSTIQSQEKRKKPKEHTNSFCSIL